MESQLERAADSQRQQVQQADMALERLKKQVELSSEKAYAEMKLQMEKVEEDLNRSKSLREKQAKDFSEQLAALRQRYEQQLSPHSSPALNGPYLCPLRGGQAPDTEDVDLRFPDRPACTSNRCHLYVDGKNLMAEQRSQHEQERTRLQQQHSAEKDSLVQQHQREVDSLEKQVRATLQQHQQQSQEWRKCDAQDPVAFGSVLANIAGMGGFFSRISSLEAELAAMMEQLQGVRAQHKRQLAEMTLQREEERQKAHRDKEEGLKRLRSEMENLRRDLERSHQQEKAAAQEKVGEGSLQFLIVVNFYCLFDLPSYYGMYHILVKVLEFKLRRKHCQKLCLGTESNSRLMQVEEEYGQKLSKSTQLIVELQTSLRDSKEEAVGLRQAAEQQLEEAHARWDGERRKMSQNADEAIKALQEKVESLQRRLHDSEKKLFSKELEGQEKVTEVRRQYEEKIKGLMPAELQTELEDTITSLKSQVGTTS
ncbi:unnamed protein product [Tetraodon nigroviridis]|uniref:(spotted green pufferfish) hypothetical protein n=1 Tax=Tetraodon nigroviridis TaxID=99883 RepID=Q4RJK4_TETNG|nr:unnamed protein product [Tetraodon nigroviridis]